MGYVPKKIRDTKNGVTTVRLRPDGTPHWQVVFEDRHKSRPANTPREQPIHQDQLWSKLGIDPKDNFETVQKRCRELNAKLNAAKRNTRALAREAALENSEHLIKSAFLPETDAKEFERKILFKRFAGDEAAAKYQRLLSHWKFTQAMIAKLQLEPKDYADESFQIYRYFQRMKISPAYAVKILRVLNAWGQFYAKRHGGMGIEPVKMPRGKQRQDIVRAYQSKDDFKGQADPLAPAELQSKQKELLDYNYYWLYLSVWLGLRPEEVDNLKDKKHWRTTTHEDGKTPVLWVFQTKLTSVDEKRAWKPIPLWDERQQACLAIITIGNFKRPLNKTLRKAFPDKRITAYSGRKGFTDLMLSLDQSLEHISVWMGHTTIETTWKHYKQKQVVQFTKKSA